MNLVKPTNRREFRFCIHPFSLLVCVANICRLTETTLDKIATSAGVRSVTFFASGFHTGSMAVSLKSIYGKTLQTSLGAICEPTRQFHASARSLLFDAETNTSIRFGRSSLSCKEMYDDVSGVFVQYVCKRQR